MRLQPYIKLVNLLKIILLKNRELTYRRHLQVSFYMQFFKYQQEVGGCISNIYLEGIGRGYRS
jgi:hypothetical protein